MPKEEGSELVRHALPVERSSMRGYIVQPAVDHQGDDAKDADEVEEGAKDKRAVASILITNKNVKLGNIMNSNRAIAIASTYLPSKPSRQVATGSRPEM